MRNPFLSLLSLSTSFQIQIVQRAADVPYFPAADVGVGGTGVGVGGIGVGVGGTGVGVGGTGVGWAVVGAQPLTINALRMSTNPKVDSFLFISCFAFLVLS